MHRLLLAFGLVIPLLPAQSPYVSPAHHTEAEGLSSNSFPFGTSGVPFRYQQIHDDVPTMAITGLQFRRDDLNPGVFEPAFSITFDAWISTAPGPAASASTTFDTNHGLDKIQCVTNRTIVVPPTNPMLPLPWQLDIPFDIGVAFPFIAPASLCWEVQITARNNTSIYLFDSVEMVNTSLIANPPLAVAAAGVGCRSTGRTQPMNVSPSPASMDWPNNLGTLVANATQLQANGFFVWSQGLSTTSWNGVPLPFVIPTTTGAPSGTCTLYTDPFFVTLAQADVFGNASLIQPFPTTAMLNGLVVYTQTLGLDAAANAFGLTASHLGAQQLVAPYSLPQPVRRVYSLSGLPPTGYVSILFLVTRFY